MSILSEIQREELELEMTPMIDVTFLLLLFFLLTLRFKTLEGKLAAYLPKDAGSARTSRPEVDRLTIRITLVEAGEKRAPGAPSLPWDGRGRYEFVGRRLRYDLGPLRCDSLDALRARLRRQTLAGEEPRPLTLAPGRGVTYGDVVPVLDLALGVGFREISFPGSVQ